MAVSEAVSNRYSIIHAEGGIMRRALIICLAAFLSLQSTVRADDKLHQRPQYVLHTGDVLSLDYRYTPEFNQTVTVQPDGYVNLNIVGNIKVSGLTINAIH